MINTLSRAIRVPSLFRRSSLTPPTVAGLEDLTEPGGDTVEELTGAGELLVLRGITKGFPGVVANDHIDLETYRGEVHAILGENGAGKSTLMKIIYGFYQPDSGSIFIEGRKTRILSPNHSRRLGIGMVFQNFALIPALTVAENLALFLPQQGLFVSRHALYRQIEKVSEKYDLQVSPKARISDLSMGERQKVELIKLLLSRARILIFDEPTSVLAPHEVEGLFRIFAELKRDGYSILFITHKMREVLTTAERVTVLRHGKVAATTLREEVDANSLVSMMLGIETPEAVRNTATRQSRSGKAAVEFRDVTTKHAPGDPRGLHNVSFDVMPGEILGMAGVSGNGQQELGDVLLGLRSIDTGVVYLSGEDMVRWSVSRILDAGVAYIPEDALAMAVVPQMKVDENLVMGELHKSGNGGFWLDKKDIRERSNQILSACPLKVASPDARVEELSGGNVQRVVLARELTRNPSVLLAYYPTRGLDVLTAEATRRLIIGCREQGGAVVLISEDLDELLALSDRLVVMYQGRIAGHFEPETASVHEIGLLMTGHQQQ